MSKGAQKFAPSYEGQSWFSKLNPEEKSQVNEASEKLAKAMVVGGAARIIQAQVLFFMKELLDNRGTSFTKFLKPFHIKRRSAYRYVKEYENAKGHLTEVALKAAMARGMNMLGETKERPLGVYTDAVKRLPPPKPSASEEQVNAWLDQVEEERKKNRGKATEPEVVSPDETELLLKECYRFFVTRVRRVPGIRNQKKFTLRLNALQLAEVNITEETPIEPEEIPDDFIAVRGRPRLIEGTAKESA
jgi:hypothetical protein